jgi:hypothetical protein
VTAHRRAGDLRRPAYFLAMVPLFQTPLPDRCWICGSTDSLSREHKYKASDLRRHFQSEGMRIFAEGDNTPRIAQGPKSDALKFHSPICNACNSANTQAADRAYDLLVTTIEADGGDLTAIDATLATHLREDGPHYTDTFRYFAKLLGCHLADLPAPIPKRLCEFVKGETDLNCIWLEIRHDRRLESLKEHIPEVKYVAHGGLVVISNKVTLLPERLYSTLTIGRVQFIYYLHLHPLEVAALRRDFPEFVATTADAAQRALVDPIPDVDLERLGLDRQA